MPEQKTEDYFQKYSATDENNKNRVDRKSLESKHRL